MSHVIKAAESTAMTNIAAPKTVLKLFYSSFVPTTAFTVYSF